MPRPSKHAVAKAAPTAAGESAEGPLLSLASTAAAKEKEEPRKKERRRSSSQEGGPVVVGRKVRTRSATAVERTKAQGKRYKHNMAKWNERLEELRRYKMEHGRNSEVSAGETKGGNYNRLGKWASHQRRQYRLRADGKPSTMTDERVFWLESIGFRWSLPHGSTKRKGKTWTEISSKPRPRKSPKPSAAAADPLEPHRHVVTLSDGKTLPGVHGETRYHYCHPSPALSDAYRAHSDARAAHVPTLEKVERLREELRIAEAEERAAMDRLGGATRALYDLELREPGCDWNDSFRRLIQYRNDRGGGEGGEGEGGGGVADVPLPHNFVEGSELHELSLWVAEQRAGAMKLMRDMPHRYQALRNIGFEFDLTEAWLGHYEDLVRYRETNGSLEFARVPTDLQQKKTYYWLLKQRMEYRKYLKKDPDAKGLTPGKVRRLEAIGIEPSAPVKKWEDHFKELVEFKDEHGHVKVPQKYVGTDGTRSLARWVMKERKLYSAYREGNTAAVKTIPKDTEERIRRLDELGFVWRVHKFKGHRGKKHKEGSGNDEKSNAGAMDI